MIEPRDADSLLFCGTLSSWLQNLGLWIPTMHLVKSVSKTKTNYK